MRPNRSVNALFATTSFMSAALSFAVEPMLGKALLPSFGGGAAVWTAVMLWFQCGMLVGYAAAHAAPRFLGDRMSAVLVVLCAFCGACMLPDVPTVVGRSLGPVAAVLATLTAGYGVAVFAMSANSPLLQRWSNRTTGREPYRLYVVSNAGSLVGLISYPLLVEPNLSVQQQGETWRIAYFVLAACVAACAFAARSPSSGHALPATDGSGTPTVSATWRMRSRWIAATMLPSSLLLGTTQHLTVDVAPFPLLWILPLSIYLITFMIAFADPSMARSKGALWRAVSIPLAMVFAFHPSVGLNAPLVSILVSSCALCAVCLLCHGLLVQERPAAGGLTDFYLCMAVGGALGGVANAILAPLLLDRLSEYPIAMCLGCLVPSPETVRMRRLRFPWWLPSAILAALLAVMWSGSVDDASLGMARVATVVVGVAACAMASVSGRRGMALAAFVGLMCPLYVRPASEGRGIASSRDFYGPLAVVEKDGRRLLMDGTTIHGMEWMDEARWSVPLAYYHRESGIGRLFASMDAARGTRGRPAEVLAVGLGTGAIACYGNAGTRISFVEIDPDVVDVARSRFRYLSSCGHPAVEIADGRKAVETRKGNSLDLLIVDAFSSDAIPAHLLTEEAFASYLSRVRPGGVVALHVSNRYLDMVPVVAASAMAHGAVPFRYDASPEDTEGVPSTWTAVVRDPQVAAALTTDGWKRVDDGPTRRWIDGKWDLVSSIRWH